MAYVVQAVAGDCLCTIARRHGFRNCGTIRSHAANHQLLDAPLQAGDNVTVPQARDGWVYTKLALGRRWTIRWLQPIAPPQPVTLRIVRKTGAAPAVPVAVQDLGISRLITRAGSIVGNDDWVDHQLYDHDATSSGDPCTFSVEVHDPNATTATVSVRLEALEPTYDNQRAVTGHTRFAAGAERDDRTLLVTLGSPGALAAGQFWSSDLRLVADRDDKAARPRQTLLVTDLFDAQGAGRDIEILDQRVRATYEYADCHLPAGEKCKLAVQEVGLRRGRSVDVEIFILRATPDGTQNDNGFVTREAATRRLHRNCRRVWAQEELTFELRHIETVDPPCDMLTVADPDGRDASGHVPNQPGAPGRVGFRVTNAVFGGNAVQHQVGPLTIAANATPTQTAAQIVNALNQLAHIQAVAMPCAVQGAAAQGSVDILIHCDDGHVTLDQLTPAAQQDSAQPVAIVHVDVANVPDHNFPSHYCAGGPPARRLVFKAFQTHPQRLSVFVVRQGRGGLTTGALGYLNGGPRVDAAVRNCMTMKRDNMSANLDEGFGIFPHEIGHALTDADHTGQIEGALMFMNTNVAGEWYDTKRVTGPGFPAHDYEILADNAYQNANGGFWTTAPGQNVLGVLRVQTTTHDLVAANATLTFTNR